MDVASQHVLLDRLACRREGGRGTDVAALDHVGTATPIRRNPRHVHGALDDVLA